MLSSETISTILNLFRHNGHPEYGERCSVLSHSVQAGLFAKDKGYPVELIAAAFLHDIGHILPETEKQDQMGRFGTAEHEKVGAEYLRACGFPESVVRPVENHVAAKRYLCYAKPEYLDTLSEASLQTLKYQGGPMQPDEAARFEQDPFFETSVQLRYLDEEGKLGNFSITEAHWRYFEEVMRECAVR